MKDNDKIKHQFKTTISIEGKKSVTQRREQTGKNQANLEES
jgi:hypothetical protein